MAKHILIPTNYTVESLNLLKGILEKKSEIKESVPYHIHFVTGYHRGDSIRDLLLLSETDIINKIKDPAFNEACDIIKNKYPHLIEQFSYEIFSNYFQEGFNHFLKSNDISEIYYSNQKLKHKNNNVFDLTKYIKRCNVICYEIYIEKPINFQTKGLLAQFFT